MNGFFIGQTAQTLFGNDCYVIKDNENDQYFKLVVRGLI